MNRREFDSDRRRFFKHVGYAAGAVGLAYLLEKIPIVSGSESNYIQDAPAQSSGLSELVIGRATVIPTIDGVWQQGEWDDAAELALSPYGQHTPDAAAYLRFKYDDSKFYGLADVTSDDGSSFTQNGRKYYGSLGIAFDTNNNGLYLNDPSDFLLGIGWDKNGNFGVEDYGNAKNIVNDVIAAAELGTSPHSNKPHRIWEYSLKIGDIIRSGTPKDSDGSPLVRFGSDTSDSSVNLLAVNGQKFDGANGGTIEMKFGPTPIPEDINPLPPLGIASLILYLFGKTHKSESRVKS